MIRVTVQGINNETTPAFHYAIAGQPVVVQHKVDALDEYSKGAASAEFARLLAKHRQIKILSASNSELRYHASTPLAGGSHRLRYWRKGRRGQIDIDGSPSCYIDFKDQHIHVLNGGDLNVQLNLEVVIGPALLVLMAYMSRYCLHASAVMTPVGTIAFLAESGLGKSTLAENQGNEWAQVSDDVLPIRVHQSVRVVEVRSDFPQLKLNGASVPQGVPDAQPLDYMIRLKPTPTKRIEFTKVSAKDRLIQVVRHTVAAKLYSRPIMQSHVSFARKVSLYVPMAELEYPRDWAELPELRERITEFCGEQRAALKQT